MADLWKISIEAWPHSSGLGAEAEQKLCGDRVAVFAVRAVDMKAAFEAAEQIAMGMRTNPAVWRAPIVEIKKGSEQ